MTIYDKQAKKEYRVPEDMPQLLKIICPLKNGDKYMPSTVYFCTEHRRETYHKIHYLLVKKDKQCMIGFTVLDPIRFTIPLSGDTVPVSRVMEVLKKEIEQIEFQQKRETRFMAEWYNKGAIEEVRNIASTLNISLEDTNNA